MDAEKILKATKGIRDILTEYTCGANLTAKRKADEQIAIIRGAVEGGYLREKAGNLSGWAEILYSARKHERYGGVDAVKHEVIEVLSKIESFVKQGRTT